MITSAANPKIKLVRKLIEQRRARYRERAFVVEGTRLLREALQAGALPEFCLYVARWLDSGGKELLAAMESAGVPCFEVSEEVLRLVSDTTTPQGVIAVVPMQELPWPERPPLVLVLDGVREPGNLGAILRTASAAGVRGILLTHGSVDPYNPKAVRAGMGAHFKVALRRIAEVASGDAWNEYAAGYRLYVSAVSGGISLWKVQWEAPSALVVGGEAFGVSRQSLEAADVKVTIPMSSDVESLNVVVASGILLFTASHALGVIGG